MIVASNLNLSVRPGTNLVLNAGILITNTVPTFYQWRLNGTNLVGATNATLTLNGLNAAMAGSYSVIASNFIGAVTNSRATLQVKPPPGLAQMHWNAAGEFTFAVTGSPGDAFIVQVSTSLAEPVPWVTIFSGTVPSPATPLLFTDPGSRTARVRFYRVRLAPTAPSPPEPMR